MSVERTCRDCGEEYDARHGSCPVCAFKRGWNTGGAYFDRDRVYRFKLWREWQGSEFFDEKPRTICFVMLNPSRADEKKDDPTLRRCIDFAKQLKFERVDVVNLFSYVTSSPKILLEVARDCAQITGGNEGDEILKETAQNADMIVLAWGANGATYRTRVEHVLSFLVRWKDKLHAFQGFKKKGFPPHPLRLSKKTKILPCFDHIITDGLSGVKLRSL